MTWLLRLKYKGKKKDCIERGREKEAGPFSTTKALMTHEMLASVYKGFSLCFHMYVCNVRTSVCRSELSDTVLSNSLHYFLRQCLSMNLCFTNFTRQNDQQDPETLLSLPLHHWDYKCTLTHLDIYVCFGDLNAVSCACLVNTLLGRPSPSPLDEF